MHPTAENDMGLFLVISGKNNEIPPTFSPHLSNPPNPPPPPQNGQSIFPARRGEKKNEKEKAQKRKGKNNGQKK
jgi:hypothetical protein